MNSNRARLTEQFFASLASQRAPRMVECYAHSRVGPAAAIFTPTDVNRRGRHVMEMAKASGVLVKGEGTDLSIEPYEVWSCERRATRLLEDLIPRKAKDVGDMRSVKVDWSIPGGFAEDISATFAEEAPPKPHFGATDVHRRTRHVLAAAKKKPVFVDHKSSLLTIDDWSRRRFEGGVAAVLQDVWRFQATRYVHSGESPSRWAFLTAYPWIAALPREEADQFADELLPYLLDSVRRGSLDSFLGNLRGWRTAAEIHSSRMLQDRFARPLVPARFVEVGPPDLTRRRRSG